MPHQDRLERRTRGFARLGQPWGPFVDRARRDEAAHAKRIFALFDDHDVLLTPMTAQPPVEVMRWEGLGALRTTEGMGVSIRTRPRGTCSATPRRPCRRC